MPALVRALANARWVGSPTAMGRGGVSAAVRPGLGLRLSGVRLHVDQIRKNQAGKCDEVSKSIVSIVVFYTLFGFVLHKVLG